MEAIGFFSPVVAICARTPLKKHLIGVDETASSSLSLKLERI